MPPRTGAPEISYDLKVPKGLPPLAEPEYVHALLHIGLFLGWTHRKSCPSPTPDIKKEDNSRREGSHLEASLILLLKWDI